MFPWVPSLLEALTSFTPSPTLVDSRCTLLPRHMFHLFPVWSRCCVFPSQEMRDLYKPSPKSHLSASVPKPVVFSPCARGAQGSTPSQYRRARPPPSVLLALQFSAPLVHLFTLHNARLGYLFSSQASINVSCIKDRAGRFSCCRRLGIYDLIRTHSLWISLFGTACVSCNLYHPSRNM